MKKRKSKVKSPRSTKSGLTLFEVRRDGRLRLRLAIADDAIAGAGDELGALLQKVAPHAVSTRTVVPDEVVTPTTAFGAIVVDSALAPTDFVVSPQHDDNDTAYHAGLRERLTELFGSLCDSSLSDALEIAREERSKRAEGGN